MQKLITIAMITIIATASAFAADPINPLTGEPMKQPLTVQKTESKSPNMPNPYIPAPGFAPQYPTAPPPPFVSPFEKEKEKEKDKVIKPEEQYAIDGIVNSNIIILDRINEDKYMQVKDMTVLDNGCLVKYPAILCGDQAKKALKLSEDKDELSHKVLSLTKENAALKSKVTNSVVEHNRTLKKITSHEHKIKDLELKNKELVSKADTIPGLTKRLADSATTIANQGVKISTLSANLSLFNKTLSEKQKAEIVFNANKKAYDAEIAALKKSHATEIAAIKKTRETEIAASNKATADAAALAKKNHDLALSMIDAELANLKKLNSDSATTIKTIVPKLTSTLTELATSQALAKETMADMSMLTNILFKSSLGTDYNIPKIGKIKGVQHENLIFAFVPIDAKEKADAYLKNTLLRAYRTDNYVLYINDKKLVED